MHLLPVLLAENILQLQTIHNCFACKQKNKGGKEKGFSGDMYVQTISNTPVHFSKNSKQKFEYEKKSFLTPFRWCYDRQTNSFIPLSLLDFCNPQCNSFLKFVRIVKKYLIWCLLLLFNFNDMNLIVVKAFQGAFIEFASLCDDW